MPLREKNGRWECRFKIAGQPRVSNLTDLEATEPNRKKAEPLEKNHRDSILKGQEQARRPKTILFSVAVDEFLTHCQVEHKDHPNTVARVKTSMTSLLVMFGQRPIGSIDVPDVESYKVWRLSGDQSTAAVKSITLRHDLDAFSKFFEWAIRMGYATFNVVLSVSKPSTDDAVRMYIFSIEEEFMYFASAKARSMDLHDVTMLMINQGMRPEEVVEIEKKNVDLSRGTLRIPRGKTKAAQRTLRLTTDAMEVLRRRIETGERSDAELNAFCARLGRRLKTDPDKLAEHERRKQAFVFPARRSGKRGKAHISLYGLEKCHNDVLNACKEMGQTIPCVLYDVRHTFATRSAKEGMPLPTLASILGHSSLRQVQKYVHPTLDHQQAEMDRIDKIRQDTKRQCAEKARSKTHSGPTEAGNSPDFHRSSGKPARTKFFVISDLYSLEYGICRASTKGRIGGAERIRTAE